MRKPDVCVTPCGNTGCDFNACHNKLPDKETNWVYMKLQRRCGGWMKPKAVKKGKKK